MSRVEEDRLMTWNSSLEKRASALRSRRILLEEKLAMCVQLEASLVELANENDATERLLSQKERYLVSRTNTLDQVDTQYSIHRGAIESDSRKATLEMERTDAALNNEWRILEDEKKSAEIEHQQKMNRLQHQLEELSTEETTLVERLRQLQDADMAVSNQLRQLKQKEDRLREIGEATIRQMKEELRERESLLERR